MSLPAPLGFQQWANISDLFLSDAQGEEETQALKNPQVPEGFIGGLSNTFRDESFQRAGGTYRKNLAPRLSARARTSLCFFHLELYAPSYILHETFLGEGKKSQIKSVHKNLLMENSRGDRR